MDLRSEVTMQISIGGPRKGVDSWEMADVLSAILSADELDSSKGKNEIIAEWSADSWEFTIPTFVFEVRGRVRGRGTGCL